MRSRWMRARRSDITLIASRPIATAPSASAPTASAPIAQCAMAALRGATREGSGGVRTARCSGTWAWPGNGGAADTTSVKVGTVAGMRGQTPSAMRHGGQSPCPAAPVSIGVVEAQRQEKDGKGKPQQPVFGRLFAAVTGAHDREHKG